MVGNIINLILPMMTWKREWNYILFYLLFQIISVVYQQHLFLLLCFKIKSIVNLASPK